MVSLYFNLTNPFTKSVWKPLWTYDKYLTEYKVCEFQLTRNNTIFEIEFSWTTNCDHPGVSLGFGLFGYVVDIGIYDTRHKED